MKKAVLPILLLTAVFATPASANYFSNPRLGINLNIGSAPNPKPSEIRETYTENENTIVYPPAPAAAPEPLPPPPPEIVAEAPPPPAPPPVVALPPTVRQFLVFFDFDKSNITPEAHEVVAQAVKAAMQNGGARITVTGHTDTVGSFRYNQALSERRAMAVKTEMVRMGMNAPDIATIGRSFSDPLVPTGPGVREPQNRRALIDLGIGPVAELN